MLVAFTGMEEVFPHLFEVLNGIEHNEEMMAAIITVFDNKWKVKDDASPELKQIRSSIIEVRRSISKNFSRIMKDMPAKDFWVTLASLSSMKEGCWRYTALIKEKFRVL